MYHLLKSLKDSIIRDDVVIDSPIFRIHCAFMPILLFVAAVIITGNQYIGTTISCLVNGVPQTFANTYCWTLGIFEIQNTGTKIFVAHYQFIGIILFIQAIMFYFPKHMWNASENGFMSSLVAGLNSEILDKEVKKERIDTLINYLTRSKHQHETYLLRYLLCEALCLINVISQIYFMNKFFEGDFWSYGFELLSLSQPSNLTGGNSLKRVFAIEMKCTVYRFGPSQNVEKLDAKCFLPQNAFMEKIVVFSWFLFLALGILLALLVCFRVITVSVKPFRYHLLASKNKAVKRSALKSLSDKMSIGDWWLISNFSVNMDRQTYKEVITELAKRHTD